VTVPLEKNSSFSESLKRIDAVCATLLDLSIHVDQHAAWPEQSVSACIDAGVFRWFLPEEFGGWNWNEFQVLTGYLRLSQSCLTTTFILTQWQAAVRRILNSANLELRSQIGKKLADGSCFVTVGISQLSTSRQHTEPALKATPIHNGFVLNGFSPWVTAAPRADLFVLGASLNDGRQILAAVPGNAKGIKRNPGASLLALASSCTDKIELTSVEISNQDLIAGPIENVLLAGASPGGGVGGLHTSILAIGLSMGAAEYLREQSYYRNSLRPVADKLSADVEVLRTMLEQVMTGKPLMSAAELRRRANTLVLRTTQAALQVAKGSGFAQGHPVGRWAREALFFLVWSCPQPVVDANLCDLANMEDRGNSCL
jgi:alkylation response protein AidB-like acyl-CoA dehydrogenase